MITVITTYNLEIFKIFYEHKYHDFFKENLYLYVDQDDSSEFRKIVDPQKTIVFDKKDFREFYGEKYLSSLTTFSKIYFLNFLFKKNLLNDAFYFTDDDILLFDESFRSIETSHKAIYARDMILKIHEYYVNWPAMSKWIADNFDDNYNIRTCATNFFFPKLMVEKLSREFTTAFDDYMQILYDDRKYIEKLNARSKSARNAAFSVFYLDTPFFNVVFPRLGIENYEHIQIYLTAYSHFRKLKESLKTNDTGKILKRYFSHKSLYPKKQPLFHFSVNHKLPLMKDSFNYFNDKEYVCKDIDDILKENPKEKKKINSTLTKSLF